MKQVFVKGQAVDIRSYTHTHTHADTAWPAVPLVVSDIIMAVLRGGIRALSLMESDSGSLLLKHTAPEHLEVGGNRGWPVHLHSTSVPLVNINLAQLFSSLLCACGSSVCF